MINLKAVFAALCLALLATVTAHAQSTGSDARAVALQGFDPVAYFTDGRPIKGSQEFAHNWDDTRYLFSSANHRSAFAAEPDRYAPQFGALCSAGLSMGKQVTADPTIWKIVDGKLYIFSSTRAREMVDKDPALLERSRLAHQAKK